MKQKQFEAQHEALWANIGDILSSNKKSKIVAMIFLFFIAASVKHWR